MTDHHEALKIEERNLSSGIASLELFAVDVPFREPFRHAASVRSTSESLFIKCITDHGSVGFGEALPRNYVTGENRDTAYQLLKDRILPRLLEKSFDSFQNVKKYLQICDGKAPLDWVPVSVPQLSAWGAVDLALLDAFGREFKEPALKSGPAAIPNFSGVLSQDLGIKFFVSAVKIKLFGFQQVKIKVDEKHAVASIIKLRKILGDNVEIRIDANMAWGREQALHIMRLLPELGISIVEQPLAANDIDGLVLLKRETDMQIIADESCADRESLKRLIEKRACSGVNFRISKCGGMMATLARIKEAQEAGIKIQLGCHVGESSLLSAAQMALASHVPEILCIEGCFGSYLLKEDPCRPVLQFGWRGYPPKPPTGYGWGVDVNERVLRRYAVRHDVIRTEGR